MKNWGLLLVVVTAAWVSAGAGCGSSDGGGKSSAGAPGDNNAACSSCGGSKCKASKDKCAGLATCNQVMSCLLDCSTADVGCRAGCVTADIDTNSATAAAELLSCLTRSCLTECFSTGGGSGDFGGSGNAGASNHGGAGGTSSGGASSVAGASATAGSAGAPVVYHCAGTATVAGCSQCAGSNPTCNCFSIPGCTGDTQTICAGTPTEDCTAYGTDFPTCVSHGCKVGDDGCYGPQCADLSNSAACTQLAGCQVTSSHVTCSGSLPPCEKLSNTQCTARAGCHLEATP